MAGALAGRTIALQLRRANSLLAAMEGEEREKREKRREMPPTYGSHVRKDDLFFSICCRKSQV